MKRLSLVLVVFSVLFAQAQVTNVFSFNKAKRLMSIDSYQEALPILDSLSVAYPNNFNIKYLIGKCYLQQAYNKEKAISFLSESSKETTKEYKNSLKNTKAPKDAYYFLAKAYLLNSQLDECITTADILIEDCNNDNLKGKTLAIKENANNAKDLMLVPVQIKIELLDQNINSKLNDYSALLSADETVMVFTSRREGSIGGLLNEEGKYYEDIYISYQKDGQWSKAENMGENVNTNRHDACVALSSDGETIILYRDDYGIGNLYISQKDSLGWTKATKISDRINSKYNETHASFSHDGQILYFVSDIKDGFGGKDIYFSKKLPNGDWAYPQNIGEHINTSLDEDGVFMHPDGQKLYFSSKAHKSMGGYDMFYCDLIGDTAWSSPKNMGYPINTTDDDMFAVFSSDNKRAYYSANKKDGAGGYDIYRMNLMSLPERNNTIIKGFVRDSSGEIIRGKLLKVTNKEGKTIGKYKANSKGLYTLVLQQGLTYNVDISSIQLKTSELRVPNATAFFITQKALEIETIAEEK